MKAVIAVTLCFLLSSCGTADELLKKIPNNEFKMFEYHRVTSGSSADIIARNSSMKDGYMIIESLEVKESWPLATFQLKLEGYERKVE